MVFPFEVVSMTEDTLGFSFYSTTWLQKEISRLGLNCYAQSRRPFLFSISVSFPEFSGVWKHFSQSFLKWKYELQLHSWKTTPGLGIWKEKVRVCFNIFSSKQSVPYLLFLVLYYIVVHFMSIFHSISYHHIISFHFILFYWAFQSFGCRIYGMWLMVRDDRMRHWPVGLNWPDLTCGQRNHLSQSLHMLPWPSWWACLTRGQLVINAGFHYVDISSFEMRPGLPAQSISRGNFTQYGVGSGAPSQQQGWPCIGAGAGKPLLVPWLRLCTTMSSSWAALCHGRGNVLLIIAQAPSPNISARLRRVHRDHGQHWQPQSK